MKNKKLHLILTIFSLVVFCTISLLSVGCRLIGFKSTAEEAEEELERIEAEHAAAEQAAIEEEQAEVEEASPDEESADEARVAEEAEKLIPNEPITYSCSMQGIPIILIVNFKTKEVTGSIEIGAYPDWIISNGKIDLDTLKITDANVSGIKEIDKKYDKEIPFNGTITGKISEDLRTVSGELTDNDTGESIEFTGSTK